MTPPPPLRDREASARLLSLFRAPRSWRWIYGSGREAAWKAGYRNHVTDAEWRAFLAAAEDQGLVRFDDKALSWSVTALGDAYVADALGLSP